LEDGLAQLLLRRRGLGVRVVLLVGFVMADSAASRGPELAVSGHVTGDATDYGAVCTENPNGFIE
jgi:hypothetical protein